MTTGRLSPAAYLLETTAWWSDSSISSSAMRLRLASQSELNVATSSDRLFTSPEDARSCCCRWLPRRSSCAMRRVSGDAADDSMSCSSARRDSRSSLSSSVKRMLLSIAT